MIISFNCSCGNQNPTKAKYYDGCLGYEALVCTVCGRYYDYQGENPADNWSLAFAGIEGFNFRLLNELEEAYELYYV